MRGRDLSLRFWQKKSGRDQQVLRIDLHKGGRTLGLRFSEGLGLEFTEQLSDAPGDQKQAACDLPPEN